LWIPRVILFPAYLVSEFVIRRPLGALLTLLEEYHLRARWNDFFTFGPEREIGLFPSARIDLGLHARVGLHLFWHNIVPDNDLSLRGVFGGVGVWSVNGGWISTFEQRRRLQASLHWSRRNDAPFFGFGPQSGDVAFRFGEDRLDSSLRYVHPLGRVSHFTAQLGQRRVWYDSGSSALGDDSLAEGIGAGAVAPPPALHDGFWVLYAGMILGLDSRPPPLTPRTGSERDFALQSGSGVAWTGHIEHDAGLKGTRALPEDELRLPEWLDYGTSLTGTLDLTGMRRELELELDARFTDPLLAGGVPFTEQASLGGAHPLRGFVERRLVDRSAVAATLRYRWPIWQSLEGELHYAIGNVFGEHLLGFDPALLRASFGVGINTVGPSHEPFEMLIAFGTRTLESGGGVESIRFVFGSSVGL